MFFHVLLVSISHRFEWIPSPTVQWELGVMCGSTLTPQLLSKFPLQINFHGWDSRSLPVRILFTFVLFSMIYVINISGFNHQFNLIQHFLILEESYKSWIFKCGDYSFLHLFPIRSEQENSDPVFLNLP